MAPLNLFAFKLCFTKPIIDFVEVFDMGDGKNVLFFGYGLVSCKEFPTISGLLAPNRLSLEEGVTDSSLTISGGKGFFNQEVSVFFLCGR